MLSSSSLHNIRIERLWRDVRKDSLESFRQVFMYLEETGLLVMDDPIHRICLYLVFQNRVQKSLDRTLDAWNHHKIRTEHNKTPIAIFELSRQTAITRGFWTGDPGDEVDVAADAMYGFDGEAPNPPPSNLYDDPSCVQADNIGSADEMEAGILVNSDDELNEVQGMLGNLDFEKDDGNWGINVYCEAVITLLSKIDLDGIYENT